ncbi:MAG TPA: LuxR C-terminal-related transcriptional regulator, partial [Jiangellaceae bacterium]|nr:LuxR C-terminal-related transcriptional regulator [Jiangellaceae bacterium]
QIEALSADAQAVLRTLAVGAGEVSHELLTDLGELDDARLDTALREAVAAQVLRTTENGFRFRHALLQEAIAGEVLPGERTRLHARYAEAIERRDPAGAREGHTASLLAYHWAAAHEVNHAFGWSVTAGNYARSAHAHRDAQRQYERAIDLWDRVDPSVRSGDRAELIEHAVAAAQDADDLERAVALVDLALEDLGPNGPRRRRGTLLARRARLIMWSSQLDESLDLVTTALELLEPGTQSRMEALDNKAAVQMISADHEEALRTCAAGIAEATEYGDDVAVGALTITQATAEVALGRVDASLRDYERGRTLIGADLPLLLRYHVNLSDTYHLIGRHRDAVRTAQAGLEVGGTEHLRRSHGAMLAGNAAEPLLALGEWDQARDLVDRALATLTRRGRRSQLQMIRAWYDLWTSNVSVAARTVDRLRAGVPGRLSEPQFQFPLRRLEAEIALAKQDPVRAWQVVEAGLELPETCAAGQALPLVAAGAAAVGAGGAPDPGMARDMLRARLWVAESRTSTPVWPEIIEAELAVEDVGAWERAAAALGQAEGPVHLSAYAQYRRARALLGHGDRTVAGEALREAVARADRLGATLISGWARDLGTRAGIAWAEGVPSGPEPVAGLTRREREVLRLVAEGHSNGQIAEYLVISTKTASVHVSNILAKLGVSTRGEAAAAAHRAGELAG